MNEERQINWIKRLIKLVEDSDIQSLEVSPLTVSYTHLTLQTKA